MGKYGVLFGTAAILIGLCFLTPLGLFLNLPQVELISTKGVSYTQYHLIGGSVEEAQKETVILDMPVVPKSVYVQAGEQVENGQLLAEVDREATMEAVAALASRYLGGYSDGVAAVLAAAETDAAISLMIPEKIYSTASGTVSNVALCEGQLLLPQTAAVTVSESDRLRARFFVPEEQMGKVKEGMEITFSAVAAGDKVYRCVAREMGSSAVSRLDGLSYKTGVEVYADILDDTGELKSGYTLNGAFPSSETEELSVLPFEAIGQDEEGEYVWLWQDGFAVRQGIETGQELTTSCDIVSGLPEDALVIYPCSAVKKAGRVRLTPRFENEE